MSNKKLPASGWIQRPQPEPQVNLFVRISPKLKARLEAAVEALHTNQTKFIEGAILWYLDELEKEISKSK